MGDARAGVAAVVDPRLDIDEYLELAGYLGVRIADIFETHNHADHVSGHGRLAAATGARIHVHALVRPEFEHEAFEHGHEWQLGSVRIRALHTPGHRPEHTAFLLSDTSRTADPWAVLSGDSLFVGDVARPDLAVEPDAGARASFHSLHGQLLGLGDEVELWPGHLGGSMCGGPGMDLKVASTIGFERRHNRLLGLDDEDAFTRAVLAGLGPQPPNFEAIVALNHGPLIDAPPPPRPLSEAEVSEALAAGALVVDTRGHDAFAAGHIPGSVSIPLDAAGFGTRLAWLARPGEEVVFVGGGTGVGDPTGRGGGSVAVADAADAAAAAGRAAAVGLLSGLGYLADGIAAWTGPLATVQRLPAAQLQALLAADPDVQVLDVRERADWQESHLPGSISAPWHGLDALPDGVDRERPVAVICASGQRAGIAAGLLARQGARHVIQVVDGGVREALRSASAPATEG